MPEIYLPFIAKNTAPKPVLGTWANVTERNMVYAVPGQSIGWLADWSKIEPEIAVFDWSKMDAAYELVKDYPHWIQCKNSPPWAQSIEGLPCSPPRRECWEDFAEFVWDVIDRYHPFMVELWNEPEPKPYEIPPELIGTVGCWGDGSLYGEFVAYINWYEKVCYPDTIIAGGALMLNSPECWEFAKPFIEAAEMDVLSFHAYPTHPYENYDEPFIKAQRLRKMTDKPLRLTETSYRYFGDDPDEYFEECQAKYLRHLHSSAIRYGVEFVNWYTLANNNWCHTDLVESDRKKLAWYEFERLVKGECGDR